MQLESQYSLQLESHGKIMLCGEYFATIGVPCISFPTHYKQILNVGKSQSTVGEIYWKGVDFKDQAWIEFKFNFDEIQFFGNAQQNNDVVNTIISIFSVIKEAQPHLFEKNRTYFFKSQTKFNRNWGLGTSSTLIHLLSQWSGCDAFQLQEMIFGGSGFDVATAIAKTPILFYSQDKTYVEYQWNRAWTEDWWVFFPGKKQNSRNSLTQVGRKLKELAEQIETTQALEALVQSVVAADSKSEFEKQLCLLTDKTGELLNLQTAWKDFKLEFNSGCICKYLGAWGGDMILMNTKMVELNHDKLQKLERVVFNELVGCWQGDATKG